MSFCRSGCLAHNMHTHRQTERKKKKKEKKREVGHWSDLDATSWRNLHSFVLVDLLDLHVAQGEFLHLLSGRADL